MALSTEKVASQTKDEGEEKPEKSDRLNSGLNGHIKMQQFRKSRLDSQKSNSSLLSSSPLSSSISNETSIVAIKEHHRPDLKRLSLNQLKELGKKQEKIVQNKKLLSNLKDKGEKATVFYLEILKEITAREEQEKVVVVKTEQMLEELTIKEEPNDHAEILLKPMSKYKDAYSENRAKLLDQIKMNKRFNQPKCKESSHITSVIKSEHEIKTLNYEESLETLEMVTKKEKSLLREKMIRFCADRMPGDDDDNDDSDQNVSDEDDYDDDYGRDSIKINLVNYSL